MTPPSFSRNEQGGRAPEGTGESGARPLSRRPAFWVALGALAGLLLAALLLRGCAAAPLRVDSGAVPPDTGLAGLLDLQRAHNKGLEEEVRRLQGLLREDPCALPALLGDTPEKSPVAPSYGASPLPPSVNATMPPSANATAPPPANATMPPAGNATSAGTAGGAAPTAAPAPATVAELLDQATVFIISVHGKEIGLGSGFFVAPGVIATNSHVAQGADAQIFAGNKALGGMQAARLLALSRDESRDYALLGVTPALAAKVPALQFASSTAARTERVSAWGFPGYITAIDPKLAAMAEGDVTAVPEVVYSEGVVSVVLDRQPPVILHTASLSQGNSGGPLVNDQGLVVGINTFIRQADQSYSQTNIALSGADLARFMDENGVRASVAGR